jgi:hypothetical protein
MTEDYTQVLSALLAARGDVWRADWEYPGYTLVTCDGSGVEIVIGADGQHALINARTTDGRDLDGTLLHNAGALGQLGIDTITATVLTLLDKYHP